MTKVGNGSSRAREKRRAVRLSLNLFKQYICSTPPASSMAKVGNGRDPYRIRGAREKNCNKSFRSHSKHICSQLGGDFASFSATVGMPELEQILKHKTFTRSEAQRLKALVESRTMEESPSPFLRVEASTNRSLKKHKYGDESHNLHDAIFSSNVVEEDIASPAKLAKPYEDSTRQAPRQDLKLINNNNNNERCLSKTSPQHPSTMENLPEELLSNIFIHLFARQLAQMRSVSKSWNTILSQSSFIKSHLNHSIRNKDQILLVFHGEEKHSSDFKPFTAKPCHTPSLELINFIKLPVNPHPEYTSGFTVIGSVNGLICTSYNNHSVIHIWNPSLSAVLTLPPYSTPYHGYILIESNFRFGYDPKTDDYKVVKLTGLSHRFTCGIKWWLQIEIYSMRKGSWELITERFPLHVTSIIDGDYVCVDGHDGRIHWLCCIGEEKDSRTIVTFDLFSETFREMPLPHSILDHNHDNTLGVFAEKLCVISQVGGGGRFEVWVMEEYGVAESWVKRHVFSHFSDNTCLFGFTSHGKFLTEDEGYLVLYDPYTNEQKVLENHCPEDYAVHHIVEYVDSLVWVAP